MKYIIVKAGEQEYPIIFPEMMVHKDMAIYVMTLLRNQHGKAVEEMRVTAAGFINSAGINGPCHGRSETLNIGVNVDDIDFIKAMDYCHGDRASAPFISAVIKMHGEEKDA